MSVRADLAAVRREYQAFAALLMGFGCLKFSFCMLPVCLIRTFCPQGIQGAILHSCRRWLPDGSDIFYYGRRFLPNTFSVSFSHFFPTRFIYQKMPTCAEKRHELPDFSRHMICFFCTGWGDGSVVMMMMKKGKKRKRTKLHHLWPESR